MRDHSLKNVLKYRIIRARAGWWPALDHAPIVPNRDDSTMLSVTVHLAGSTYRVRIYCDGRAAGHGYEFGTETANGQPFTVRGRTQDVLAATIRVLDAEVERVIIKREQFSKADL